MDTFTNLKTPAPTEEPGKIFRLDFPDYNQPGEMLSIIVDKSKKSLMESL